MDNEKYTSIKVICNHCNDTHVDRILLSTLGKTIFCKCIGCGSRNVRVEDYNTGRVVYPLEPKRPPVQPSVRRPSAYERTKAQVHATGNKWAIENFHATHD